MSNAVGQPDEAKELLGLLVNRPARKVWGAAVRWALGIGNGNDIQLQLQALPCPASNLKKCPTLRGDNVPVMIITTFHVWCQLFDDPTAGTATPPPFFLIGFVLLYQHMLSRNSSVSRGLETGPSDPGSIPTLKQMPTKVFPPSLWNHKKQAFLFNISNKFPLGKPPHTAQPPPPPCHCVYRPFLFSNFLNPE